jgi:hypothetical protein
MDGGEKLGLHLPFLDSTAKEEESGESYCRSSLVLLFLLFCVLQILS